MRKYHFLIALFVIVLDRVTKRTVARRLSLHDSITVIPGFFRIIHAENPGAAFGIFADSPSQWKVGLLIGFSVIALLIVSDLHHRHSGIFSHHPRREPGSRVWYFCGFSVAMEGRTADRVFCDCAADCFRSASPSFRDFFASSTPRTREPRLVFLRILRRNGRSDC